MDMSPSEFSVSFSTVDLLLRTITGDIVLIIGICTITLVISGKWGCWPVGRMFLFFLISYLRVISDNISLQWELIFVKE
jgi:hypothetical protein